MARLNAKDSPAGEHVVERTNEPKIVLLVRLLSAIDEGCYSFEQLKDKIAEGEHRPSTRSLRRYLAVLADAGFPWYFDRAVNLYRFSNGYSLRRLDLSSSELFGLVALRSIGATLGGAIGTYVDEVTEKLVTAGNRRIKEQVVAPPPAAFRLSEIRLDGRGEKIFEQLSAAERNTRSVTFTYQDNEGNRSKRAVDPYGFIVGSGRVYCVAYDHDRRDKRIFAIDSIADLDTLAQSFIKPASFNVESFAAASISRLLHNATVEFVMLVL